MSLQLRPHTMTVYLQEPTIIDGNVVVGSGVAPGGETVRGQITPLAPDIAYAEYGVSESNPHMCMVNQADAAFFAQDSRVIYNGRRFRVVTSPRIWDAEKSTSYGLCILSELQDA